MRYVAVTDLSALVLGPLLCSHLRLTIHEVGLVFGIVRSSETKT